MSVGKRWVSSPENRKAVVELYRSSRFLTLEKIAQELHTTFQNIQYLVRSLIPEEERKALAAIRYSASKTGTNSPHFGKRGAEMPNFKGECSDGHGYLTKLWRQRRWYVHDVTILEALGLDELPHGFIVHHINGVTTDNRLDNLCLVTRGGHATLHADGRTSLQQASRMKTLAEAAKYLTSR